MSEANQTNQTSEANQVNTTNQIKEPKRRYTYTYAIEMLINNRFWVNAWQNSSGGALVFKRFRLAEKALQKHLDEWKKALADGDLSPREALDAPEDGQFRIVEIKRLAKRIKAKSPAKRRAR